MNWGRDGFFKLPEGEVNAAKPKDAKRGGMVTNPPPILASQDLGGGDKKRYGLRGGDWGGAP